MTELIEIGYHLLPFAVVFVLGEYLFWLLRGHKLTVKYATVWIFLLVVLLVFAIYPPIADWLARLFGFELTSNFLFAGAVFVLLIAVI